mmetsp:Transcript_8810/g.17530  ORF Transcript_8810/g.17530 Transcript_8810/m.17530 type:complete len:244 (+) Transcript_8810:69-800(+)
MASFSPPQWARVPPREKRQGWTLVDTSSGSPEVPIEDKSYYLFGRNPSMGLDFVVEHPDVSQRHAALVWHEDGRCFVIDLASRNGVSVNGDRIPANKPVSCHPGTRIEIGPSCYEIQGGTKQQEQPQVEQRSSKVRASHLLVKHTNSRRPSSWKQATITRSPEEALEMIHKYREQIITQACDFAQLASTESDCSSAKRGGDLGWFGPGEMQKEFEDATYSLDVGELSGPVHSGSGIHLILRTG